MPDNIDPIIYEVAPRQRPEKSKESLNKIDNFDVFDLIRDINDPEHPLTLEQLRVVQLEDVTADDKDNKVDVWFTPTIPHCSMATLIGLSIKVKLLRSMEPRFKIDVRIAQGTHNSEEAINKQLSDKERVAAAMENPTLSDMVNRCLATRPDEV